MQIHRNEAEQGHNANAKIKQAQVTHATPPNDPNPEDDDEKIYDHTNHPLEDTQNIFPTNPTKREHGLCDRPGHLPDNPNNEMRILRLVRDRAKRVWFDKKHKNMWYAQTEPDGTQLWAAVRTKNNQIQNCGLNQTPRPINPNHGLNNFTSKENK